MHNFYLLLYFPRDKFSSESIPTQDKFYMPVYDLGQIQQLPLPLKLRFLGLCVRGSRHTEILLPIKIH